MTSKIVYGNNNVSAKDYDIVQLVSPAGERTFKIKDVKYI